MADTADTLGAVFECVGDLVSGKRTLQGLLSEAVDGKNTDEAEAEADAAPAVDRSGPPGKVLPAHLALVKPAEPVKT